VEIFAHAKNWNVFATNGMDSIPGSAFLPDELFAVPSAFLLGDANGDGIVDQSELDTVYANYLPNSPWLLMTNVIGLGETNVTFALSDSISGGYSVEVSTTSRIGSFSALLRRVIFSATPMRPPLRSVIIGCGIPELLRHRF
jgi:hypothetical protein